MKISFVPGMRALTWPLPSLTRLCMARTRQDSATVRRSAPSSSSIEAHCTMPPMIAAPAIGLDVQEPGLPPDEFIAGIWLERRQWVRDGRIKQPHPLRIAMGEGKISREALVAYVKNRYYFLANINRKDAQII